MKLLLDTQMLIWASYWPELLPVKAHQIVSDDAAVLYFSPASLWEVSIKSRQNKPDFHVDARFMYDLEMPVTSLHTVATGDLPMIHKDPFDRILVAQARVENVPILTCDAKLKSLSTRLRYILYKNDLHFLSDPIQHLAGQKNLTSANLGMIHLPCVGLRFAHPQPIFLRFFLAPRV
ncbi:hypothetical protein FACS1894158_07480 [Betaproteobacteria bacterium]|nr:hypothetical protein FACS1894158_07480 [Betaproteobacteria bacterium]